MTRGGATGFIWSSDEPRVDARVKDLREMTIGRTDDSENPLEPAAPEAARLFVGVDGPRRHRVCQNEVRVLISDKGDRPWNRLAALA